MKNDLIDRYVYAVTKNIPKKTREDIKAELNTLIEDMLEAKCKDETPTNKDIKAVLLELGSPISLAEKYSGEKHNFLIGPGYFTSYKFLLKLILLTTSFGLLVAHIIIAFTENQLWYVALGNFLSSLFISACCIFAFITLIIAIFERKGIEFKMQGDNLDDLPPVPNTSQEIKKGECYFAIALGIIFTIVFLAIPQIFGFALATESGTTYIPIFNTQYLTSIWYLIVSFAALGILKEVFKLFEGRYTKRYVVVAVTINVISVILVFAMFSGANILNPEFTYYLKDVFGSLNEFVYKFFEMFNYFVLGVMIFALILDTVTALVKALKYDVKKAK